MLKINKVIYALALFAVASAANAIPVELVSHQSTAGSGTISVLITDGSHVQGFPASTAVWDWDGSTLTSTGLYSYTGSIGGSPFSPTVTNEQVLDLVIATGGTPGGTPSATSFVCVEGTFLSSVGFNGCGNYTLGVNFFDESTTVWGPGLAVSQTIGGDDVSSGGPITLPVAFEAMGFEGFSGVDGLTPGDLIFIGDGIPLGAPDVNGELMTFRVVPVPAAAWLFGSALGLLGWARRRVAQ